MNQMKFKKCWVCCSTALLIQRAHIKICDPQDHSATNPKSEGNWIANTHLKIYVWIFSKTWEQTDVTLTRDLYRNHNRNKSDWHWPVNDAKGFHIQPKHNSKIADTKSDIQLLIRGIIISNWSWNCITHVKTTHCIQRQK